MNISENEREFIIDFLQDQDYLLIQDEEQFNRMFPKGKKGEYCPEPFDKPDYYPCMAKPVKTVYNSYHNDEYIMEFIYI